MAPAESKPSESRKPLKNRAMHVTCYDCGHEMTVRRGLLDRPLHCPGCGFLFLLWSGWTGADAPPVKSLRAHLAHRIRGIRGSFAEGMSGEGKGDLLWLIDHIKETRRGPDGKYLWSWHVDDMKPEVRAAVLPALEEIKDTVFGTSDFYAIEVALGHVARMLEENCMHEAGVFEKGWLSSHVRLHGL